MAVVLYDLDYRKSIVDLPTTLNMKSLEPILGSEVT